MVTMKNVNKISTKPLISEDGILHVIICFTKEWMNEIA
jgi:hypothetical protein